MLDNMPILFHLPIVRPLLPAAPAPSARGAAPAPGQVGDGGVDVGGGGARRDEVVGVAGHRLQLGQGGGGGGRGARTTTMLRRLKEPTFSILELILVVIIVLLHHLTIRSLKRRLNID